jgi:hypothetical protein
VKPHIIKNFINKNDIESIIFMLDKFDKDHNNSSTRKIMRFGLDNFNGNQGSLSELGDFGLMVKSYGERAASLAQGVFDYPKPIYLSTLWLSKQTAGSKIKPHKDTDGGINMQYSHAAILYLNSQDEGGEIYFPKIDFEHKPETGDLIIFECRSMESLHGVKMVTQDRYAIPIWLTDDPDYQML